MLCVLQHIPRCLAQASGVIVCGLGACTSCSGGAGYKAKVTYQAMFVMRMVGCSSSVWVRGLQSGVGEIQLVTGECLISLMAGIFNFHCEVSSQQQCKGTEVVLHQSRSKGCGITADAPCMFIQVLPLLVEQ